MRSPTQPRTHARTHARTILHTTPLAGPPQKAAKAATKQTTLKPKLSLNEIPTDHWTVTAAPVEPALTVENAGSRFVFVPASHFSSDGIGGWIAKCASSRCVPPSLLAARGRADSTSHLLSDAPRSRLLSTAEHAPPLTVTHAPSHAGLRRCTRTRIRPPRSSSRTQTALTRRTASPSSTWWPHLRHFREATVVGSHRDCCGSLSSPLLSSPLLSSPLDHVSWDRIVCVRSAV